MRNNLQQNPDDLAADDPKRHIYALYDLTIGASIAFLPSAFFILITQQRTPEISAIMVLAVGITLMYEWWLNRLYGKRHTARFTKRKLTSEGSQSPKEETRKIVTSLYFIVNNLYVFLLVMLPVLLAVGSEKPYGNSIMVPFLVAMIALNVMDAMLDVVHFIFNPVQRPQWRSAIHLAGDIISCLVYALPLMWIVLTRQDISWLIPIVIADIVVSIIIWFWLGPLIWRLISGRHDEEEEKISDERWVAVSWGGQMQPNLEDSQMILSVASQADQDTPN